MRHDLELARQKVSPEAISGTEAFARTLISA
jgi:hypothetical protein